MKFLKPFIFVSVLFTLFLPLTGNAATISFSRADESLIAVGDTFSLAISLDSSSALINAIEGEIAIPDMFSIQKIYDGNSHVSLWVEKPYVENNTILFSGIIPGGVSLKNTALFEIVLRAEKEGRESVTFTKGKIFLQNEEHAGESLGVAEHVLMVEKTGRTVKNSLKKDATLPEPFVITIAQDESFFENKQFAIFSARDTQSGIDRYELAETFLPNFFPFSKIISWTEVESPHPLQSQSLIKQIYVRALDKEGNTRTVVYISTLVRIFVLFQLLLLGIIVGGLFVWRKRRRRS